MVVAALIAGCQPGPTATPSDGPGEATRAAATVSKRTQTPTPQIVLIETYVNNEADPPCSPLFSGPYQREHHQHFIQWTPDSSQLIFSYQENIWTVDREGTRLERVVDANPGRGEYGPYEFQYGFQGDLSPTGSLIAYSTCQYTIPDPDKRDGFHPRDAYGYEIATIGINGTEQRRLTLNGRLDHYPAWSPDGMRIAFIASPAREYQPGRTKLFIMNADGSDVSEGIAADSGGVALYPPVWSPDGRRLALIVNEGDYVPFSRVLSTVRADGSGLVRIREITPLPSWSPDGSRLAFANTEEMETTIYSVRPDGTDLRQVWSSGTQERPSPISSVSWSPDGSEILFVSDEVYVVGSDGSGLRGLAFDGQDTRVAWAPDGSAIALYDVKGKLLTLDRSKMFLRGLVRELVNGKLYLWNPPGPDASIDLAVCSGGFVVPEPHTHSDLVRDCETLLEIRDTLSGGATLSWDGQRPIGKWWGVSIGGSPPRVRGLSLRRGELMGTLPAELGELTALEVLDISGANANRPYGGLTEVIPPELGNLSRLGSLNLNNGFLSGNIPPELGALVNLRALNLSRNQLSGRIPPELGRLTQLHTLDISNNFLDGSLPPELGSLSGLSSLSVRNNNFSGCLPSSLGAKWFSQSGLNRCDHGKSANP